MPAGLVDRGQALKLEVDRGPDDRQRPSDEDGGLLLTGEVGRVDVLQRAVDGAVEVLQERRTRAQQVGDDAAQVLVDDLLGSDRDAPGGVLPAAAAVDRAQRHAVRPEEHEAFFEVVGQHPPADRRVRGQLGELHVAEIGRQPTEAQAYRLHEPRRKRDEVAVGGGGEQTAGHHPIPLQVQHPAERVEQAQPPHPQCAGPHGLERAEGRSGAAVVTAQVRREQHAAGGASARRGRDPARRVARWRRTGGSRRSPTGRPHRAAGSAGG